MKAKWISVVLVVLFVLAGCASATIAAPMEIVTPSQSSTPVPPFSTLTPIPTSWWLINATPLNLSFQNNDEIISTIDQLHPLLCIRKTENLLLISPTPVEPARQVSPVKFTEIPALPEANLGYINERADNVEKSRTVFAMPELGAVNKLYVKDNISGKVYQIDFGTTDRPLDWLQWISSDTFIVAQQGHLWIMISAINVAKQQYEYYGITQGCPIATPMP